MVVLVLVLCYILCITFCVSVSHCSVLLKLLLSFSLSLSLYYSIFRSFVMLIKIQRFVVFSYDDGNCARQLLSPNMTTFPTNFGQLSSLFLEVTHHNRGAIFFLSSVHCARFAVATGSRSPFSSRSLPNAHFA